MRVGHPGGAESKKCAKEKEKNKIHKRHLYDQFASTVPARNSLFCGAYFVSQRQYQHIPFCARAPLNETCRANGRVAQYSRKKTVVTMYQNIVSWTVTDLSTKRNEQFKSRYKGIASSLLAHSLCVTTTLYLVARDETPGKSCLASVAPQE